MECLEDPENYVGLTVNVTPDNDDDFMHEFQGVVIGTIRGLLKVVDQDDDVWCVTTNQVVVVKEYA